MRTSTNDWEMLVHRKIKTKVVVQNKLLSRFPLAKNKKIFKKGDKKMKKRILSILLVAVMLVTAIPVFAVAVSASEVTVTDWTADVITLYTAADFVEFKRQLAPTSEGGVGNNFTGKTVKLGADIDFSETDVQNFGGGHSGHLAQAVTTGGFQGTFDGQYHTIKNLTIIYPSSMYGLFGRISPTNDSSGTYEGKDPIIVKNFSIIDSTISIGNNSALLFSQTRGGTLKIENVYIGTDITFNNPSAADGNAVFVNIATRTAKYYVNNCVYDGDITVSEATRYGVFFGYVLTTAPTVYVNNCLIANEAAVPYDIERTTVNGSNQVHGVITKQQTIATDVVRYTASGFVDAIPGSATIGQAVDMPAGFTAREGDYPVPTTLLPFFENAVDATNTSTVFKGIQYNSELGAIRFVGLVNGETTNFSSIGFEVYAYGPTGVMQKLDLNVTKVYTAITEEDGYKTAENLGADYIYVANLGGMQEGKGIATFVVKTYSVDASGVKTYTDQATVTFGTAA